MKAMKAMKAKNAIIITGGSVTDYAYYNEYFENADLVICADGGVKHLEKFKIYADYFIGDFDSCDFESFKNCEYVKNAEIIRFKCEKNETDTEIAIDIAIEKKCSEIILIGALGTRFDHSLSNVFLLKKAMDKNVDAVIVDEHNKIRLTDKSISLTPCKNSFLSFVALEKTENLCLENLKYPLSDYTLDVGTSRCISNEFIDGKTAKVSFSKGLLLVMITND